MKSRIAVSVLSLSVAVLSLALGGCNGNIGNESDLSSGVSRSMENSGSSAITDSPDNSGNSGSSTAPESAPEPPKPDGEPTFLTAPDGTPIYTSEITSYQSSLRKSEPGFKIFPLDTFNKETFSVNINMPYIVCDGFAYAFIPRFNINVSEAPDKFTEIYGVQMYSGEELPISSEYFKIRVGDKFGGLTVKSAQAIFSNYKARTYDGDPADIAGIYLTGAEIEYEGEVGMTGCIQVMKTEGYETEGDLLFYPDGDCVSKIPVAEYRCDYDQKIIYHTAESHFGAYGELNEIRLGNMYDYSGVDFDGLEPGDDFVRVKLTIKNPVVSTSNGYMNCNGEPTAVEVLR